MKRHLFFLCCLAVASGFIQLNSHEEDEGEWKAWKDFHGKTYASGNEETARRAIWRENLKKIAEHNARGYSHVLAMNHFGDLTQEEHHNLHLGTMKKFDSETKKRTSTARFARSGAPASVDWRMKGYVTPVKNQGRCSSDWAFSATGSLEGQHFKKTGKLVSLSEQNLIDCSTSYGNNGCQGGLMDNAFRYIKANGGIDTEASYPYEARNMNCRFKNSDVGATNTGFVHIPSGNEEALKQAIAKVGPVSVAINATHSSFQLYHSSVYNEPSCSSTKLSHAVLVVGYGTSQGKDYWLVKNSWGTRWGMEGYIMMSRNMNNQCGIATFASFPLVWELNVVRFATK